MDRKLWFTGGEPEINADDIQRNVNAALRALNFILKAYDVGTNENFIVAGCELTINAGVDASVTEGYIYLNGELLQVDAQTVSAGTTDFYYYEKATTYDPNGTKIFVDGVTHDTWQINRGVLVNNPFLPAPSDKLDARGNTLTGKIHEKIKGTYKEIIATSASVEAIVNYLKLGINGAGVWTLTIPKADDPTVTSDANFINVYEQTAGTPMGKFEVRDVEGTLIREFTKPEFAIIVNDGGVWKDLLRLPNSSMNNDPIIKDLGAWNMDADDIKIVPHGLLNKETIYKVVARIFNDANDEIFEFSGYESGRIRWNDVDIILQRDGGGGLFNNGAFDDAVINRGQVYIYHT